MIIASVPLGGSPLTPTPSKAFNFHLSPEDFPWVLSGHFLKAPLHLDGGELELQPRTE